MNLKQFKYVQILAQEGSFSKAADVLNITQPSLSQYIKKIEGEVGLALFDRTNGEVRLTDAGRVYIEAGQRIMEIEHQMKVSFTDLQEYKTGSLIIGTAPYRAASMMPDIVASFQKRHPGIHIIVREGTTAEVAEGMEHGEYDLALTLLPVNDRLFNYEKVAEEELVLAVPASYEPFPAVPFPDRRYAAIETSVLNGKRFVMLTDTQFMQRQLIELLLDNDIKVSAAATVKSLEAQIEMVKAGVGVALMPTGIERFCRDSSVVFYSFIDPLPKREVVVFWRKDRILSGVAEELKEVIHSISW